MRREGVGRPQDAPEVGRFGSRGPPRALQTTEGFGAFHNAEIEKWWPIIKAAGIKGE
jgi:hypothetical protein